LSQKTLLIAALVLMAGGLLLGGLDLVLGNGGVAVQSEQGLGPGGQQGPNGQRGPGVGLLPRRPGFYPWVERGPGIGKVVPRPPASPKPSPTP
jgi:hypothetical protein